MEITTKSKTKKVDVGCFWVQIKDENDQPKGIKIDHKKYIEFLRFNGFRRYDLEKEYFFIQIINNVIEQVQIPFIQDFVLKYVEYYENPEKTINELVLSKFYSSPGTYFHDKKFSLLMPEPNLVLNKDEKETCYIYYRNGFVECSPNGYELRKYNHLKKFIFKNQIINRDFIKGSHEGNFRKFCEYISEPDTEQPKGRFESLQTLIGYLCHSYYDTKMKAVCLTDSTISDSDEGRTGKTLIGKALAKIKNTCEISGKSFSTENKFRYSELEISTQITFLNDLRKDFVFELIYNDISEGLTVEKKNKQSFTHQTKMIVSANSTLKISGASGKDRIIEFELTNHYSEKYSPKDDFNEWFFSDWNENEWGLFDNFMMNCICKYLKHGIIEPVQINLDRRKLIEHTHPDFYEWMEDQLSEKKIQPYSRYNKKEIYEDFLGQYPSHRNNSRSKLNNQTNFIKCLKSFIELHSDFDKECKECKSNGLYFIELMPSNNQLKF